MHWHQGINTNVVCVTALLWLCQLVPGSFALAKQAGVQTPSSALVKLVILSRHGVRSPIPNQQELAEWTSAPWPAWNCDVGSATKVCEPGQLTPRGGILSEQMGNYYRTYLAELLPASQCATANDVFFWADLTQRTKDTALGLLRGFSPSCDTASYLHTSRKLQPDRIFHPVSSTGPCALNAARAEQEILVRAGGSLSRVAASLVGELETAQEVLQCCQLVLCEVTEKACRRAPAPAEFCKLTDRLPSCLVRHPESGPPTQVLLGGALRSASTFAELLLLEYGNGFPEEQVGWGRIRRDHMTGLFRLHTTAFDLEQRTPYIARRQGSMLLKKILLALENKTDDMPGTAPVDAKFVAYVGHDTNISNVASMVGLSWEQTGYQKNQTPPAGALIFELRRIATGADHVSVFYVAQTLEDMRNLSGMSPQRTAVPIPGCSNESLCPLAELTKLVGQVIDADCSQ